MKDNIISCLSRHAAACPEKIVFNILQGEEQEESVCFRQLDSYVKTLASRLAIHKLEGKRVLLIHQDILEFIVSFLACNYLGIIPVPVSYTRGSRQLGRLRSIIADADATAVFSASASIPPIQEVFSGFPELAGMAMIGTDSFRLPEDLSFIPEPSHHEISFIQYTSGSTGEPKGVIISGGNLLENQSLIKNTFGSDEQSVIFSWLPFLHDMGLIGNILHTIYTGCSCVLMSPYEFMQKPKRWLDAISKYKVTHSGGPDFAYELCIDRVSPDDVKDLDLSGWKVAYNGSEPVRAETIRRFSSYFKPAGFSEHSFYPCYGLAEATLLVSGKKEIRPPTILSVELDPSDSSKMKVTDKSNSQSRTVVSCGSVIPGVEVRILSTQHHQLCHQLEEGEICISGGSVTHGYWNKDNTGLFHEFDGKQFLRTGDLGFFYKDELFVQGRIKEMLIIRGRNFYPYDLEEAISAAHHDIERNGVVVFCNDSLKEEFIVIAGIKRASAGSLDIRQLILSIDNTVRGLIGGAPYDILLTVARAIPRTTSGKLQRIKCRDLYRSNGFDLIGSKSGLSMERNGIERELSLIAEVLRNRDVDTIKRYLVNIIRYKSGDLPDSLFDKRTEFTGVGIDSVRAMELVNIINKELDINLDVKNIFHDNTLSGLITDIENILWLKSRQTSGKEIII